MARNHFLLLIGSMILACLGCSEPGSAPELSWGRKGVREGELVRPRACLLDREERLWVVDFTARVQAFDLEGVYAGRCWTTPDYRKGRPSGLGLDREGNLIVCDSHYGCLRIYSTEGAALRVIHGDFAYISDAVQDADGHYFLTEFGECQRVTRLDPDGKIVTRWGVEGQEPGQFARPRAIVLGPDNRLYVADSCNHRIQVFEKNGTYVRSWGKPGDGPGEMRYPYDLAFAPDGTVYVAEYGNHRVQRFTSSGEPLGSWGGPGRQPGKLHGPWGLVVDRLGRVHVLDTENHRVQRFRL